MGKVVTCIAAIIHNGAVWMAGDRHVQYDTQTMSLACPKVFRRGDFAIGGGGDGRALQVIEYAGTPPKPPTQVRALDRYMATVFSEWVRKAWEKAHVTDKDAAFLVGIHGHLYIVDDQFCADRMGPIAAVGTAATIALGSLFSTTGEDPETRLNLAMLAAEQFSGTVRGPFDLIHIGKTGKLRAVA